MSEIKNKKIIKDYGRVLRNGSIKTLTDLDKSLKIDFNFQLHNINDLVNEFNGIMPPTRISHYVMAYIRHGNGRKIIGNHSFNIEKNMAMIFPKNIIHSTNRWSLDTAGYMLSFDDSLFEEFQFPVSFLQLSGLFKHSIVPYRVFNEVTSKKVETLFGGIRQLEDSSDPGDKKLFIIKLSELIISYQKEFLGNNTTTKTSHLLFDKFVELLELNYKLNREVKFYADLLSVHPNHLNKIVRTASKFSTKEYIHHRILQEAKYLLSATSIPIKEIAFELGFTDYNYFSRLFKSVVEQSPQQYRNNND